VYEYSQWTINYWNRYHWPEKLEISSCHGNLAITEYWGIAENKFGNLAAEVDEDENGTSYGANEYLINKVEYTIAIRVALDSSKVIKNISQKDGLETDCLQ
jgi:hypothetical protein